MHYNCFCEDGPAQGLEFWDYGPPVRVGLPHEGHILEYRIFSRLENHYIYHYHAGASEGVTDELVE